MAEAAKNEADVPTADDDVESGDEAKPRHTEGPWQKSGEGPQYFVHDGKGHFICHLSTLSKTEKEIEAIEELIAVAPEMKSLLEELIEADEATWESQGAFNKRVHEITGRARKILRGVA